MDVWELLDVLLEGKTVPRPVFEGINSPRELFLLFAQMLRKCVTGVITEEQLTNAQQVFARMSVQLKFSYWSRLDKSNLLNWFASTVASKGIEVQGVIDWVSGDLLAVHTLSDPGVVGLILDDPRFHAVRYFGGKTPVDLSDFSLHFPLAGGEFICVFDVVTGTG